MIYLPGSRRNQNEEPQDPSPAGLTSGRFTESQLFLLAEMMEWWTHRRSQEDSFTPLASLIGGVDLKATVTTTGLTPSTVTFDESFPPPTSDMRGRSYIVQAYGIPDPATVSEVYSLFGIAHAFYTTAGGWLSRYTTLGRAPSGTTSTEVRTAIDAGTGLPVLLIIGVSALTIVWTINLIILEV